MGWCLDTLPSSQFVEKKKEKLIYLYLQKQEQVHTHSLAISRFLS